ncbi:MAG: hypothetical protein HZA93_23675 [Verrucomicrobia bacterium]|nr:hypothetical protein [Verrucomicrobiota bacterium]
MSPAAREVQQKILRLLDDGRVPRAEYKEFLETVTSDCESRLDCIREEEGDE